MILPTPGQAVTLIENNASSVKLGQLFDGPSLALNYDTPGLPPYDPRTPEIIVTPSIGATYTGSASKQIARRLRARRHQELRTVIPNIWTWPPSFTRSKRAA